MRTRHHELVYVLRRDGWSRGYVPESKQMLLVERGKGEGFMTKGHTSAVRNHGLRELGRPAA